MQPPAFLNFHVLVNFSPAGTIVLSGYVTSESNSALSPQCVDEVAVGCGVRGSGVSVRVGGIGVGTVKPGLVGGRVEVTK